MYCSGINRNLFPFAIPFGATSAQKCKQSLIRMFMKDLLHELYQRKLKLKQHSKPHFLRRKAVANQEIHLV